MSCIHSGINRLEICDRSQTNDDDPVAVAAAAAAADADADNDDDDDDLVFFVPYTLLNSYRDY